MIYETEITAYPHFLAVQKTEVFLAAMKPNPKGGDTRCTETGPIGA